MKPNLKTEPTTPTASPAPTPVAQPAAPHVTLTDYEEIRARAKTDARMLRAVHGQAFSGHVLRLAYENFVGQNVLAETAQDFEVDVLRQMGARDPLEGMLIDQMLWTHVRIARLSALATQQTGLEQVQVVNEATDRALNAFCTQLSTLRGYRRPQGSTDAPRPVATAPSPASTGPASG